MHSSPNKEVAPRNPATLLDLVNRIDTVTDVLMTELDRLEHLLEPLLRGQSPQVAPPTRGSEAECSVCQQIEGQISRLDRAVGRVSDLIERNQI